MSFTLIKNVKIINENQIFESDILIDGCYIKKISKSISAENNFNIIEGGGKYLIPGVIDDQVHFREPGLTHKANIKSESKSALAGGVTSFMEMPNTNPQTINQDLLNKKIDIAKNTSFVNYSFFGGVTNTNYDDVMRFDKTQIPGIKIFMGSSTGDMLVDNDKILDNLFKNSPFLIATHCEDEQTIKSNTEKYKQIYGEKIPIDLHPIIRNHYSCYKSSSFAVELAKKHGTRLHILHISTKNELDLFVSGDIKDKRITSEACTHHLYFNNQLYQTKGSLIKWNPAVKFEEDRIALMEALVNDKIDVIASDHAPHTIEEKQNKYLKCPSGGPMVQHTFNVMLSLVNRELTLQKIVEKMCHNPAKCFNIHKRGFVREGYFADLVMFDYDKKYTVNKDNIFYKCGWSPLEGVEFKGIITHTFVNGNLAFVNGEFSDKREVMALSFNID